MDEPLEFLPHTVILENPRAPRPIAVEGIMRVGDLVLITAPWDSFKSTLGLELAWSLATGSPWLTEFDIIQTMRVGILQVEIDPGSYDERLSWFPPAEELLACSKIGFTLDHPERITEAVEDYVLDAVVLDPLGQLWPSHALNGEPFQENLKNHVSPIMRELKKLKCSVIMVHHDPKQQQGMTNRASGSAALLNDPDVRLFIDKMKDGSINVAVRNRLQRAAQPFRAVFNEDTRRLVWSPLLRGVRATPGGPPVTPSPRARPKEYETITKRVQSKLPGYATAQGRPIRAPKRNAHGGTD